MSVREKWDNAYVLGACCVQLILRTVECLWMCTHMHSIEKNYTMTTMAIEACVSHSASRKSSECFLAYSFVRTFILLV